MSLTAIFIVCTAVIWAVFDVWVIAKKGNSESISAHIIRLARKWPLFPLLSGILLGHFFWSMPTESVYKNTECKKVESERTRQD